MILEVLIRQHLTTHHWEQKSSLPAMSSSELLTQKELPWLCALE
ncbi:hypothetical protein AB205_0219900 [Aquarana catesbeiana]|uniref:Uncharacterized protein n=1 Tax=Aquarana catesbeiana TaxID=8400 RepID=A0A2G9QBI6_AQUCT|nr:hypothetical protein AB205_0219900 [Aquarana catesbeiana]